MKTPNYLNPILVFITLFFRNKLENECDRQLSYFLWDEIQHIDVYSIYGCFDHTRDPS